MIQNKKKIHKDAVLTLLLSLKVGTTKFKWALISNFLVRLSPSIFLKKTCLTVNIKSSWTQWISSWKIKSTSHRSLRSKTTRCTTTTRNRATAHHYSSMISQSHLEIKLSLDSSVWRATLSLTNKMIQTLCSRFLTLSTMRSTTMHKRLKDTTSTMHI